MVHRLLSVPSSISRVAEVSRCLVVELQLALPLVLSNGLPLRALRGFFGSFS